MVFMWSTRKVLRGVCEASNAFDSEQALHAVAASCLAMPFATAHGRNRYNRRAFHASTTCQSPESAHIRDRKVKYISDEQEVERTGLSRKQKHTNGQNKLIRKADERTGPSRKQKLTNGQKKLIRKADERELKMREWARSNTESLQPAAEHRKGGSEFPKQPSVAGASEEMTIYPFLRQVQQDKLLMMEKRIQLDRDNPEIELFDQMTPLPDNVDLRRHLMSVRNLINKLRDCPDHEFSQLNFNTLAVLMRHGARPISLLPTQLTPSSPMPWAVKDHSGLSGKQLLDEEMRRLEEYLKFSDAEAAARAAVTREFMASFNAVKGVSGTYGIELHGSEVTGLALPDSDLDFRAFAEIDGESKRRLMDVETIARALDKCGKYGLVSFRKDLNHPIINCQHLESGIDIQLSWSASSIPQQRSTALLLAENEHLRPVFLVLRIMLGARSLAEVFHGGLGSYGLFCLIACLFSWAERNTIDFLYNQYAVLHPLTTVLWSLGQARQRTERFVVGSETMVPRWPDNVTDNHRRVRAVHLKKPRDAETGLHDLSPLLATHPSVIDPANPKNDLGAKAYAYLYIKPTAILESYRLITSMIAMDKAVGLELPPGEAPTSLHHVPKPVTSLLLPLIGNYHERVQSQRARAEAYGNKVLRAAAAKPIDTSRFDALGGPEFDDFEKDDEEAAADYAAEQRQRRARSPQEDEFAE